MYVRMAVLELLKAVKKAVAKACLCNAYGDIILRYRFKVLDLNLGFLKFVKSSLNPGKKKLA